VESTVHLLSLSCIEVVSVKSRGRRDKLLSNKQKKEVVSVKGEEPPFSKIFRSIGILMAIIYQKGNRGAFSPRSAENDLMRWQKISTSSQSIDSLKNKLTRTKGIFSDAT
jgi:hypothetical protein